ncbi:cyclopropane-fatty-acyl-phospholipid synthase-like [Bradysia coprophila]|uniref:cyclopropane-fatty-acyl-phospholipid synthase-like n=1 Tax=Bradysia coprophila TaxID=38358 RepID=UPI00187D8654|nr:cyclopropane-fatty-acyl-phospholipid synthase-like [Bradysia coprophila]
MDFLINKLYVVVLEAIRVWRIFMYIVAYIGFKPIRTYITRKFYAAGIKINDNTEPHNMIVHNDWFYHRIACDGSLGWGESYAEGWWDCKKLDDYFYKILQNGLYQELLFPWEKLIRYLTFDAFNRQIVGCSQEIADKHYDFGNPFFKSFLGTSMIYSCAYWIGAKNLDEAQQNKLQLIGRKLKLKPGMRVLDVGCGWGELCKFLAQTYNVEVVGVTNSKEGAKEARQRCTGLHVDIRLQDYRDINESFDRIVSIELLEHVGRKNYRSFFELMHRCLSDDGIFLLHTIGHDNDSIPRTEPFVWKHLIPNVMLPNHKSIPVAIDNLFCIEDWHNFGPHYEKTLLAWRDNFVINWPTISRMYENPTSSFYRKWTLYLNIGAALFRARKAQVWQIVLTKGLDGGYNSVR